MLGSSDRYPAPPVSMLKSPWARHWTLTCPQWKAGTLSCSMVPIGCECECCIYYVRMSLSYLFSCWEKMNTTVKYEATRNNSVDFNRGSAWKEVSVCLYWFVSSNVTLFQMCWNYSRWLCWAVDNWSLWNHLVLHILFYYTQIKLKLMRFYISTTYSLPKGTIPEGIIKTCNI